MQYDSSKQLAQAYDAAKATFTILVGVLGAGAAADVALVASVVKDGIIEPSATQHVVTLKLGACFALILAGILVLLIVQGVVYLGQSLAATAVTILAIEKEAGVPRFASIARSILVAGYSEEAFNDLDTSATHLVKRCQPKHCQPVAPECDPTAARGDDKSTIRNAAKTPLFRGGLVVAGHVIGWAQFVIGAVGIEWYFRHPY